MASENRSGCFRAFIVSVLVVFGVAVALAVVIYMKAGDIGRSVAAFGLEHGVEAIVNELQFPKDEADSILTTVKALAARIKSGEVSAEQAKTVLGELMSSNFVQILLIRGFEVSHLKNSALAAEEKERGRQDAERFMQGLIQKKIPAEALRRLEGIIVERKGVTGSSPGSQNIKSKLTDAEVQQAIQIMKEEADKAQIPMALEKVDFAKELQSIVDTGLKEKK